MLTLLVTVDKSSSADDVCSFTVVVNFVSVVVLGIGGSLECGTKRRSLSTTFEFISSALLKETLHSKLVGLNVYIILTCLSQVLRL